MSQQEAKTSAQCGGRQTDSQSEFEQRRKKIAERMELVDSVLVVLSGKGGVGKSTVAVNLAGELSRRGEKVGLLDADMHGPSTPHMLGLEGTPVAAEGEVMQPVGHPSGLQVMSIGFLLRQRDDAVVWRGPMKMNLLGQFLADVEWGKLDHLVVDLPPGTGDEPLSVCQLIPDITGGIVVTTPQEVALSDVRKCVNFCSDIELPVLGVVENMSGYVCPNCGERSDIFGAGGGEDMADRMHVPFLGHIPMDPRMVEACDAGNICVEEFPDSEASSALKAVVNRITESSERDNQSNERRRTMRIAIPVAGDELASHFGHCEEFRFFDVSGDEGSIEDAEAQSPPPHRPGVLPKWLNENDTDVVIAGGMGRRAQQLFSEAGIDIVVGATGSEPRSLVQDYMQDSLTTGENPCSH